MIHHTCKIWQPSNVYPTAIIGQNVSVGAFCEIGDGVKIGKNTRIGSGTFIPSGVSIGKNCFIGPRVCFTNDRYPPSDKSKWEETIVKDGASIGAGSVILCGVVIGKGSTVGAGSTVIKNVGRYNIVAGNPAKFLRLKDHDLR